ncbi:hypothetical protein JTF06_06090 [Desemzia sp. RIT804]|uniref:hypothetical protein n=1 Tax=Desemzia sp. RIT 804 TaxID=2810209 RepID=UPI00194DB85D|nr:hypothetical protein [Desemzia sp. RIT 804]MBM6614458.1 hypothetical protein [Desemzia sp. RIT 804]
MPKNTQQKKSSDITRAGSNRNQQQTTRRTNTTRTPSRSVSANRNANKQQSWRELASEFKEALNELDSAGSKQTNPPKRNASHNPSPKKNTAASKRKADYSREGSGSSEGSWSSEGQKSSEGSASYEGTEFHPQGHTTKKQTVAPRDAYSPTLKVGKTDLQKNIVNAVIYKEILDKPRSKRSIR